MSLPGNYNSVSYNRNSPIIEDKDTYSFPLSNRNNAGRKERSVEDFLNGIVHNVHASTDIENNSDSITVKEDISQHSSLMSRPNSEIPFDSEETNKNRIENLNEYHHSETIDLSQLEDNSKFNDDNNIKSLKLNPCNERLMSPKHQNMNHKDLNNFPFDNSEKICTPTINFLKPNENRNNQGLLENEDLSNRLFQMTTLIKEKDEKIKKLSKKIEKLRCANYSYRKSSSSSSSSVSSDESIKENNLNKDKSNSKDKKMKNQSAKRNKKYKSKISENASDSKPVTDNANVSQSLNKIKDINSHSLTANENANFKSQSDKELATINKKKLIPDLKQKLEDLELEVRRLQQANADSIITLEKVQNNNTISKSKSNEIVINQLLVEHGQLKEELQKLKWEHSKLNQPGLLLDEINQLKKDMKYLRKQNEFLKHITKQSSRSLNHLTSSSYDITEFKETSCLKPTDSNNSSNYIYQKLQSNRQTTSATPNMKTMLKNNIESLESPYHATCQSIQYVNPLSVGNTYRSRKLSDSSSALIEDTKPKIWIETVSKNCKPTYQQFSDNYLPSSYHYNNKEIDENSIDSYVTVTTSNTERSEDEWRLNSRRANEVNNDLFSTEDGESSDCTIKDRKNFQRKSRKEYSFTPKLPSDLNLEDFVKFVRPGGKMATGRVCFIGHLPGRNEICVGLELDEEAGKHDGLFEGTRYFQCRKNRGVFISFHKIILAYKSI